LFPIENCVERAEIRPYVNAGCLVVRPEKGLLRAWSRRFFELCQTPTLQALYEKDERYPIFVHQAALAGILLATTDPSRVHELPEFANCPRRLHTEYEKARRPRRLNDLITCRYEEPFPVNRWESDLLPVEEPLRGWIREQLANVEPLLDPERTARRRRELDEKDVRLWGRHESPPGARDDGAPGSPQECAEERKGRGTPATDVRSRLEGAVAVRRKPRDRAAPVRGSAPRRSKPFAVACRFFSPSLEVPGDDRIPRQCPAAGEARRRLAGRRG